MNIPLYFGVGTIVFVLTVVIATLFFKVSGKWQQRVVGIAIAVLVAATIAMQFLERG